MKIFATALATIVCTSSASAVTMPGSQLIVGVHRYLATNIQQADYVGPLSLRSSGRGSSLRASADYGRLIASGSQRLFSTVDGPAVAAPFSDVGTNASFFDQFSFSLDSSLSSALVTFTFGIDVRATARTTGYRNASGTSTASWSSYLQDDTDGRSLTLNGVYAITDTPSAAPVSSYFLFPTPGGLSGEYSIGSGSAFTPRQQIVFGAVLQGGHAYNLITTAGCNANLVSYRIADALQTTCNLGLTWGGLLHVLDPISGNPIDSSLYQLVGAPSGYDYRRPYFPVPTARSVAVLAAVPEPSSWAMLIAGFSVVGGALRTRRAQGLHPA